MRGKSFQENLFGGSQAMREQKKQESKGRVDLTRTCCGRLVEPRLAEARDRSGQTFFAAVWRCPATVKLASELGASKDIL